MAQCVFTCFINHLSIFNTGKVSAGRSYFICKSSGRAFIFSSFVFQLRAHFQNRTSRIAKSSIFRGALFWRRRLVFGRRVNCNAAWRRRRVDWEGGGSAVDCASEIPTWSSSLPAASRHARELNRCASRRASFWPNVLNSSRWVEKKCVLLRRIIQGEGPGWSAGDLFCYPCWFSFIQEVKIDVCPRYFVDLFPKRKRWEVRECFFLNICVPIRGAPPRWSHIVFFIHHN